MTTERRRAPRVAERIPITLTGGETQFLVETRNISAAGAYCTLDRFIAPMTKLALECELPNGPERVRIRCSGVVVRVEPAVAGAEQARYHIAIFFTDLADRDRAVLSQFVSQQLSARPSIP